MEHGFFHIHSQMFFLICIIIIVPNRENLRTVNVEIITFFTCDLNIRKEKQIAQAIERSY